MFQVLLIKTPKLRDVQSGPSGPISQKRGDGKEVGSLETLGQSE